MKINFKGTLTLFLALIVQFIFAQKTITGTVSDESGPLPGVSIMIKNTKTGTATDFDGKYIIEAQVGDILEYTFVGMKTESVSVGTGNVYNVVMSSADNVLDEVIVTSMGISREKRALGYAVSELDGEEISQRAETDITKTLQGKVAGINITSPSGETGSTSSINIRSTLSINQGNSPLIILNNVPFNGTLSDIDPNNIKDMNILKGLNAAVLYGSEGRNGVILINTKNATAELGEAKFSADFSQTTYFNTVNNLPEYQNTYGEGSEFAFVAGNYGSWGPNFDNLDEVVHPYAYLSNIFPEYDGVMVPYEAKPNNVKDFFNTGLGSISSLNIAAAQEKTSYNLSVGFATENGIIGDNNLKRFNLGLGGKMQVSDKFSIASSLDISKRKVNSLKTKDLFQYILFIPRDVDIYHLPYQNPQTGESVYYRSSQNPLWVMHNTGNQDDVTRLFATLDANYKINDLFNLNYRIGVDNENFAEFDYSNKGGFGENQFGYLDLDSDRDWVLDQSLVLSLNEFSLAEKLGMDAQLGVNSKYMTGTSNYSYSDEQIVYGFLRPNNYSTSTAYFSEYQENLAGLFSQFEFNYDRFLYLTFSGRLDKGSTVESDNQSLFYPGVSLSFIPTSIFDINKDILNYFKIRGAYATSSGYPGRYKTRTALDTNPRRFVDVNGNVVISNSLQEIFANPDLRPELHKEFEVGIESKFLKNRVDLDVSLFKRISEDQIVAANMPGSTGYNESTVNLGRIDSKGVEINLDVDILKTDAFNWNLRNIFNAYESEVVELQGGNIDLERSNGVNAHRWAIVGQPYGVLVGSYAVKDNAGNYLINPDNGYLLISDEIGLDDKIIGDPNPDWIYTAINSFSYKGFTLSAQIEYIKGGDIISNTVNDLMTRGVTKDTENREGSFVMPGVLGDPATATPYLDGNGNTIPNTIQVNAMRTVFSNYYASDELRMFDATSLRLREVALSYSLNNDKIKNLPFSDLTFTLGGRNLWVKAYDFPEYINYDPENDGGNGDQTVPTTRRVSFGISAKF